VSRHPVGVPEAQVRHSGSRPSRRKVVEAIESRKRLAPTEGLKWEESDASRSLTGEPIP
jgi:hypothetical protein